MSKYHKSCHRNQKTVREDVVKCFRKNLKRNDFIQTTKELYIPVPPEVAQQNPVYRHYFNTYFIHKWKCRTDNECEKAAAEYGKFSREFDHDYLLKVPSDSNGDSWIPDQFCPWKWGGFDPVYRAPIHDTLFQNQSTELGRLWPRRLRKQTNCLYWKGPTCQKPDYKIVIN